MLIVMYFFKQSKMHNFLSQELSLEELGYPGLCDSPWASLRDRRAAELKPTVQE